MRTTRTNRKGLSQLQKHILALAREYGGEVLACDVLIEHYGFEPIHSSPELGTGGIVFNKGRTVGYNAATVAVCKSFNRLERRGLVWRTIGGIQLKGARRRRR